uniref:Uncharacterized protein n=1 Tax=viral metagenome TaxID=1070528 RepID=A0A6C0IE65_9ZZZZ
MNIIVSTMKIHNYSIVSTIQIVNKKPVKKSTDVNYNYDDDYSIDSYYDYDYCDYDYERIECENCSRLFLNTLIDNGLCEMCSNKRQRKLEIFRRKMKINN